LIDFVLLGKIVEKPVIEVAKNENKFVRLKVRSIKDENQIFEVYCWNSLTELDYEPDKTVYLKGRLTANNYGKDDQIYYNTRIVAEKMDFFA